MHTLCTVNKSVVRLSPACIPTEFLFIHVRVKNRLGIRGIINLYGKESCFRQRILGKAHTQSLELLPNGVFRRTRNKFPDFLRVMGCSQLVMQPLDTSRPTVMREMI